MYIVRAFDPHGKQWLQKQFDSEAEKDDYVRRLQELAPESKLSIVDLSEGKLEEITPTAAR